LTSALKIPQDQATLAENGKKIQHIVQLRHQFLSESASDTYKDYLQEERQNFGSDRITAAGRKLTDHSSSTSSSTKRMQASTASVSEA